MIIKIGELVQIDKIAHQESVPAISDEVLNDFRKTASSLKALAPKAEDFLYFSAIMMHAAEASSINTDGSPKFNKKGERVVVGWNKSNGTLRWETNDPSIKPYKNQNGDIFRAEELIKAHKKWIHKPLCIDHQSKSVEHVRGFIVDTYYDPTLMRVVALCALDKKNYPTLADKVRTGYSASVSMGTAVSEAICFDCGNKAKVEADFCHHMKNKTCYGEINEGLNPIELSIVVNGADPAAKIKHIIASANTLNNYIDKKESELSKIASSVYNADISIDVSSNDMSKSKTSKIAIKATDIENFKKDLENAVKQLSEINDSIDENKYEDESKDDVNEANQSSGTSEYMESDCSNTDTNLAPPEKKFASNDMVITTLHVMTKNMQEKINKMQESLDKLANTKEDDMTKMNNKVAYFQGTTEPTPGKQQYTPDSLNETDRNNEDKHMVGQMDTGPVDGMHPGPDSVGMSELERKKMLARATAEERALRRTAIVNQVKQAYFQNGDKKENPNTPTPGKTKYTPDPLGLKARETDKQMVGQKPFPGVGKVDGLHPSPESADESDELKRKEKLSRAGLRARFTKVANIDGSENFGAGTWNIYSGDKIVLAASVNQLTGGNAEMLYSTVATAEFGKKLLEKVRNEGVAKVASIVKAAQQAPAPAAAPAQAPEVNLDPAQMLPQAAPAPEADQSAELDSDALENDASGDPKESVLRLVSKIVEIADDLKEAVNLLTGEKSEMGSETDPLAATASFSDAAVFELRRELNSSLRDAMKSATANLDESEDELRMILALYNNGSINKNNARRVREITNSAELQAKASLGEAFDLLVAFAKYSRASGAILKKAQMEQDLHDMSDDDHTDFDTDTDEDDKKLLDILKQHKDDLDSDSDFEDEEDFDSTHDEDEDEDLSLASDLEYDASAFDSQEADAGLVHVKTPEEAATVSKSNPNANVTLASLSSKASRDALRYKLASESLSYSPMLDQAHPQGGFKTELDSKVSDDLDLVEDLEEKQKKMLEVARTPVRIRKEAETIDRLIKAGQLDKADLDQLVSRGLDQEAVSYYKKYFGEVDGGSEFASELVKEHVKASVDAEIETHKVKLSRAYELANQMVSKGMIDTKGVTAQVEDIMSFNDEAFTNFKKFVDRTETVKNASVRMPQIGVYGGGEPRVASDSDENLYSQLSSMFATTKRRGSF